MREQRISRIDQDAGSVGGTLGKYGCSIVKRYCAVVEKIGDGSAIMRTDIQRCGMIRQDQKREVVDGRKCLQ